MKVLLLSRYERLGASSRMRFYQYLPALREAGIEVSVAPFFRDAYLAGFYRSGAKSPLETLAAYARRFLVLTRLRDFDLVWVEAEILPWLPAWAEAWLAWRGIPYVVDYDDAIFHRYDRHPRAIVRRLLGTKIDAVMRRARAVVTGNDYLAERAVAAGAGRVEILPTAIDLSRYPDRPATPGPRFTLGWIGSRTTAPYLDALRPVLAELVRDFGARVVLVGAGTDGPSQPGFEHRNWTEAGEVAEIQGFDVGIMPLPDTPWERGKCGYKLIQYLGCCKPVVASPVGANRRIVEPGVNGFLASTPAEWKSALLALRQDPGLRERLGRAGRARVEREFSTRVNAPRLAAILREAVRE